MNKLVSTVLLLLLTGVSLAQPPGRRGPHPEGREHGEGRERIHAAKLAYIVDRLQLSSAQAATFTPVFNEMQEEVRSTRKSFCTKLKEDGRKDPDDTDPKQRIDDNLDYQQKIIDIKRKYNDRYLKIISARQLNDLYKAEREFNQMLMQRLRQQRGGGRFNRMER